ncbi:MAG TPA: GNAT family N-acetyltransferase [Gaiellales bacterium]|jgi:ribosomal protein S18 acetylase RimI-like enzyme|nr:GNAT family N-acetyltransferase [Gaiellales bacterium]
MRARRATAADIPAICWICAEGWRQTYAGHYPPERIERTIARFYTPQRVVSEIAPAPGWDGWWVAVDEAGVVVAAAGGGIVRPGEGEIFVLYADPGRRREGAGTALLDAITAVQIEKGARQQWVAVAEGNEKGIPFYEAHGFTRAGTRAPYETDDADAAESVLFWRRIG